jgi:hypothetical protein
MIRKRVKYLHLLGRSRFREILYPILGGHLRLCQTSCLDGIWPDQTSFENLSRVINITQET